MLIMVGVLEAHGTSRDVMSYTKIDKVDLNNKTVTISGKVYRYDMLDEEDAFYVTENSTKKMKYLTLGRKYYVNIHFDVSLGKKSKTQIGVVNYIGSVKQPF